MMNDDIARAYRRHQKRKVENIVTKTYQAFHDEIAVYGTLNAEEIVAIGFNLLDEILVKPLERMSNDRQLMRQTLMYQIAVHLGVAPEDVGN